MFNVGSGKIDPKKIPKQEHDFFTDEDAKTLALMLRNTNEKLGSADILLIQQLLLENGYAGYLHQNNHSSQTVNIIMSEIDEPENTAIYIQKEKNVTSPEHKKLLISKPSVNETAYAQGCGIAYKIEEAFRYDWTNDYLILKTFKKIDRDNAYSFVGKMIEITDSHTVFDNYRKRINYSILKHVTAAFLNHALTLELGKITAYQNLKKEYLAINKQIEKDPEKTPDEYDIKQINEAFKDLYKEISKVYQ